MKNIRNFWGSKTSQKPQNTHTPHGGRAGKTAMKMSRARKGGKKGK